MEKMAEGSGVMREYRKGNWTLNETMILIEAKQMDDERRMKRNIGESSESRTKPAELRWKWVEDYCWRKGCLRSQNQCNDKWDNLMRDYKKVREYETKLLKQQQEQHPPLLSYWKMEKNERKDNNLPSNMLFQIYEALVEVVERKSLPRPSPSPPVLPPPPPPPPVLSLPQPSQPPQQQPQPQQQSESDTSEYSDTSPAKRRKRASEVGSAISKSASMIAEALQACEEREERRHRDLISLHERRLKIEEAKSEINQQGINGLVDAINKLANSILALASSSSSTPK